jgi:hypothetical protein
MGFMVLDPNNDRGHKIDVIPEKGQEYQAVCIFGKDNKVGNIIGEYYIHDNIESIARISGVTIVSGRYNETD